MIKRLLVVVAGFVGMHALAFADDSYTLGSAAFSLPPGWTQADSTDDRMTFASPDSRQQLTISIMHLGKAPSFEDFEVLCTHRYQAERNGVKDIVLIPNEPAPRNDSGDFTLTFSGEENPTSRVFSGFLWIKGSDLITVYVEGIGVTSGRNSDAFHAIVKTLH